MTLHATVTACHLLSQCRDVCLTVHQSESMDGKTDEDGSLQSRERLCIGVREACALVQDVATHLFFLVGCGKVCPDNQVFFSSHSPRVTQTNTLPQSQNFLLSPGRSTLPLIPPSLRLLLSPSLSFCQTSWAAVYAPIRPSKKLPLPLRPPTLSEPAAIVWQGLVTCRRLSVNVCVCSLMTKVF